MNAAEIKGKVLKELIDSSNKEKKDFLDTGKEIMAFAHKAKEADTYKSMGVEAELWFRSTVAMTAQAIDEMCPYLYPANPLRCGYVKKKNFQNPLMQQMSEARNTLMMEYLNLTPNENDLYGESIRSINQTQAYGMGVLWTGYNQRSGLVGSFYGDVRDIAIDPDAMLWPEVNWVGRKREKKRWELADEFPEAAEVIATLKTNKRAKSNVSGKVGDLITYHEVYMKVGLHRYVDGGLPTTDEMGEPIEYNDLPQRYIVSDDGKLIWEGDWESPIFYDNLWPFEPLSFIEDEESIWPISPMRSALPFQKALNWLYIFYMTKVKFCSRSLFAMIDSGQDSLGVDNEAMVQMMNDLPILKIRTSNDQVKLADLFQQLNLNPGLENFEKAHAIIKREFQEHSGHFDIFHTGEGETQDRSATTTDFKERTSKTRINYRLDRVKKWQSKVARKEALIARYIHTPPQIDLLLGQGAGEIWGQIMPPAMPGMPLNPMHVDFTQWARETDYDIVSDSMRRKDPQTKIDSLGEAMNTVVPVQLASMDLMEKAVAYDTIAAWLDAIGAPDEIIDKNREMAAYLREQHQLQAQAMLSMQPMQPGAQPIPGPGSAPAPAAAGGY